MKDARADLLNAAPAAFLSFRDDGQLVAVNEPLLEMLGYARDELLGAHVERILGVAARIFYQTHLFPLVRLHGRADEIYLALRSSAGVAVPVLLNARRDELDGEPVTHCVALRVQERRKYEDALLRAREAAEAARAEAQAANEAKSRYLSNVSHEIRTPINALLGYADLLELNAGSPMGEDQLGYIERVRQAARHLLTLVNDVLDLAKIESGGLAVDIGTTGIAAAADAAVALVKPLAAEQEVRLVAAQGPAVRYRGDHERVVQILVNLLSNAVKFTDAGGQVELAWDRSGEPPAGARLDGQGPWLVVRVTDTGIGIPAELLEEVFEPFRQVHQRGRGRGGTGLGLAISRELARLMHGDLTVRSRLGAGSTFSLWLPAAE